MKSVYWLNEYGNGYLQLVDLKLHELPETIEAEGSKMIIKNEFHISLVWVGRLAEMVDNRNKDTIKSEMIKEFEEFTKEYSLENYELTKDLRLVKKENRQTIIVMTKVPNLDIFFKKLNKKYDAELPVQPTHITLYTLPTDKIGVGILSYEELQKYSKSVASSELKNLLIKRSN